MAGFEQALVQCLEPIFEPQRRDCSLGERAGRSPHMAMRNVWRERPAGHVWIVDADVRQYFGAPGKARRFPRVPFPPREEARHLTGNRVVGPWR